MSSPTTVVWFRRDLRVADQPALSAAVARGSVIPVFIWAPDEEGPWPPGAASRWWLHHALAALDKQLRQLGSRLSILRGPSAETLLRVCKSSGADAVYWLCGYEPAIAERDLAVATKLLGAGIQAQSFPGYLLHEPWNIATGEGRPYQVFTPFAKRCLGGDAPGKPLAAPQQITTPRQRFDSLKLDDLALLPTIPWDRGFYESWEVGAVPAAVRLKQFVAGSLKDYVPDRDRVDKAGTSRLSPRLHFGELSPRQVWWAATHTKHAESESAQTFLKELLWREFAYHLLHHFPHTAEQPLREKFRKFPWRRSAKDLRRWQRGQTGYPIVDAAMRELWTTGFMHNRARMIVASFLIKDLRLHWLEGARWFWDTLVDADLANNTLNWQWSAGSGADAAPFFRIFNPVTQATRFDPEGDYVRRWVPELASLPTRWIHHPWKAPVSVLKEAGLRLGRDYPHPIVDHAAARDAALAAFARIK